MKEKMITPVKILTIGVFMFMSVPSAIAQEYNVQFMARFDLDGDGIVTKIEYKSSGGNMDNWAEYDLDNNGILERKELPGAGESGGKKGR